MHDATAPHKILRASLAFLASSAVLGFVVIAVPPDAKVPGFEKIVYVKTPAVSIRLIEHGASEFAPIYDNTADAAP